jgi:hypothetical protein
LHQLQFYSFRNGRDKWELYLFDRIYVQLSFRSMHLRLEFWVCTHRIRMYCLLCIDGCCCEVLVLQLLRYLFVQWLLLLTGINHTSL